MSDLTGKVAVVTGASTERGIGSTIALKLAGAGASVYLVAEGTEAGLRQVQQACSALPRAGRILYGVFDLSQRGVPEKMIETAASVLGRIDVLVNVAGIRAALDFEQYTRDDFEKVVAVNLAAPFFASQAVAPIMRRQGGGRIIHIASQLARVTYAKRALYGLTKAALVHLTKSMAYELGRDGITVNAISPGPIRTQYIIDRDAAQPEAAAQRVKNYLPIGRLGEPDEIAEVALFLATTSATYLPGEESCVDGGYTVH